MELKLKERLVIYEKLINIEGDIKNFFNEVLCTLKKGKNIFVAGNGGSASQSLHLSSELMWSAKNKNKGVSVISLCSDVSAITAISNDSDFKNIFSVQLSTLAKSGDLFIALTTSGASENIIEAIATAKEKGVKTIVLTGKQGSRLKGSADMVLSIPSEDVSIIQECHLILIHELSRFIDEENQ